MADNQGLSELSDEQRDELRLGAPSRSLPAGYVFRARLILALAEGLTYRQIEQTLGVSAPTVSKWKIRFEGHGIEGLEGRHKGSKPLRAAPAAPARVIRRAQQKPLTAAQLVVPQVGRRTRRQQIHGAASLKARQPIFQ